MTFEFDIAKKYTVQDYINWTDVKCELIDGVIKLMSGVSKWHVNITKRLTKLVELFLEKENKYWAFHAPFDVMFSENTVVQPDFDYKRIRNSIKRHL
jgi:Uma2 family endonuclease